jgi:hypothetical protein
VDYTETGSGVAEYSVYVPMRRRQVDMTITPPNKITGANSLPASQFESQGLRRRAPVVESRRHYHGGAAVAQFCRWAR